MKPVFEVQIRNWHGNDWEEVKAFSSEQAAEIAAEEYHEQQCEYSNTETVFVKDSTGKIIEFTVESEQVMQYHAYQKE